MDGYNANLAVVGQKVLLLILGCAMLFILAWLLWLYHKSNHGNKNGNKQNNELEHEVDVLEKEELIKEDIINELESSFGSPENELYEGLLGNNVDSGVLQSELQQASKTPDVKIDIIDDENKNWKETLHFQYPSLQGNSFVNGNSFDNSIDVSILNKTPGNCKLLPQIISKQALSL